MIEQYLEDLEKRIEPEVEERLLADWHNFLDGKSTADIFSPQRGEHSPGSLPWPEVSVNEAIANAEHMLLQQLFCCSAELEQGTGGIMNIRANYGTGILPSLFGAKIFRMDDELNTLPTTWPLEGGIDEIRRVIDQGPPDLKTGYGGKCLETGKYMAECLKPYPSVSRYIHIYHPDLQGPMDVCELLWGSQLFIDLFDEPDLVHALLQLITETYAGFMRAWEQIVPPLPVYNAHWGMMHRGRIMLRDDSAMNLSPTMFDEFIKPYDQQLLETFHGGGIHFCGRGDHYIDRFQTMNGAYAITLSQPHLNDMERIYQNTVDKGILLLGLQREAAEAALLRGRDLHGLVHSR